MYTMGDFVWFLPYMKVLGLLFVIIGLVVFGSLIWDKFDDGRESIEGSAQHLSDCNKFTEFECIAKSGCSPIYAENTSRSLVQWLPTRDQWKWLNKVTIWGVFLSCETDTIANNS